jgi:hypothetical protein
MHLRRVEELAKQVRAAFEEIARKNGYSEGLGGLCGTASNHLAAAAKRLGIEGVDVCDGGGHVYCMYQQHVIDITATQFGVKEPVLVVKLLDLPMKLAETGGGYHPWQQTKRGREVVVYRDDDPMLLTVKKHTGELITEESAPKEATV